MSGLATGAESGAGTPLAPPSRERSPAPLYRRTPIRIACVQYDPKIGMIKENAAKVERMLSSLQPGSVDLVVLPEMALSGYMFQTPTSILPYLEPPRIGPTSLLARSIARRLRCHVVAGYPEALSGHEAGEGTGIKIEDEAGEGMGRDSTSMTATSSRNGTDETAPGPAAPESTFGASSQIPMRGLSIGGSDVDEQQVLPSSMKALEGEALGVGYNSAVVVDQTGEVVGNYRKTFLFETDKNWARAGDGFLVCDLGEPLGRVAVGICMDMNPKDFVAPWDAFELANFVRDQDCDMLIVPMNWLDPPAEPPSVSSADDDVPSQDPSAPSISNLNYWAARLTPLHDPTPGYGDAMQSRGEMDAPGYDDVASTSRIERRGGLQARRGREVVFVSCNRVGTEHGTKFVGTSAIMTMAPDPSRIELVECCNVSEERVLVATVT